MPTKGPGTPPIQPLPPAGPIPGVPPATSPPAPEPSSKIRAFEQRFAGGSNHESRWKRRPKATGTGAVHVKSFHCKLNAESLEYMDQQINEWLDAHPDYEVKMVTSSVGEWTGKVREPNLIVQVWV